MISYHVTPALRCRCPARAFTKAQEALDYARKAAGIFGIEYAVWKAGKGLLRLLKRFPAGMGQKGA